MLVVSPLEFIWSAIFISCTEQLLHMGILQDLIFCFFFLVKTRGLEAALGFLWSFPCHNSHKCVHQEWGGGCRRQALRELNVQPYTKKRPSPNIAQPGTLPNLQNINHCPAIPQSPNSDKNSLCWLALLASGWHCGAVLCLLEGL